MNLFSDTKAKLKKAKEDMKRYKDSEASPSNTFDKEESSSPVSVGKKKVLNPRLMHSVKVSPRRGKL